jgi:hypothetical protein
LTPRRPEKLRHCENGSSRLHCRHADLRISLSKVRGGQRAADSLAPLGRDALPEMRFHQIIQKAVGFRLERRRDILRAVLVRRRPFRFVLPLRRSQAACALIACSLEALEPVGSAGGVAWI